MIRIFEFSLLYFDSYSQTADNRDRRRAAHVHFFDRALERVKNWRKLVKNLQIHLRRSRFLNIPKRAAISTDPKSPIFRFRILSLLSSFFFSSKNSVWSKFKKVNKKWRDLIFLLFMVFSKMIFYVLYFYSKICQIQNLKYKLRNLQILEKKIEL